MIKAQFFSSHGKIVGFSVSGHSDMAKSGEDVLCAAVSGAVQTVIAILDEECGLTDCFFIRDEEVNDVSCDISQVSGGKAVIALSVLSGFEKLMGEWERDYPENIKKIITKR